MKITVKQIALAQSQGSQALNIPSTSILLLDDKGRVWEKGRFGRFTQVELPDEPEVEWPPTDPASNDLRLAH